ncbi:Mediator of RNA polymerase II transcription subunit 25 [Sarracenia purpurea var. burkii]
MMQTQTNQQAIMHQNPNPMTVPQGPMGLRGTAILGPRPTLNDNSEQMRLSRQENLARIHQLRQTLAAAQQQELQYQQTQLEVTHQPPYGRHQMVKQASTAAATSTSKYPSKRCTNCSSSSGAIRRC